VVDGGGLENRCTRKGTGGSNPSSSAQPSLALSGEPRPASQDRSLPATLRPGTPSAPALSPHRHVVRPRLVLADGNPCGARDERLQRRRIEPFALLEIARDRDEILSGGKIPDRVTPVIARPDAGDLPRVHEPASRIDREHDDESIGDRRAGIAVSAFGAIFVFDAPFPVIVLGAALSGLLASGLGWGSTGPYRTIVRSNSAGVHP
jgi:hypothetical protein